MSLLSLKCDYVKGICWICVGQSRMPSDMVSFVVSAGLGVSVVAGILSGMCYILAHGIQKKRNRKTSLEWYCDICGTYLRSIDGILEGEKVITCSKCQRRVCKKRCSSLTQQADWMCQICLRPPESWFQGILNAIQPSGKGNLPTNMNPEFINEIDEDLESIRKKEKEQVRDFIEKLVNVMLGENVDDASVTKLFNDQRYLPITGQSPCTAHAALKQLIEKLLQETANLPTLRKVQEHSTAPSEETSNQTYEDLLATAIINKVISSCQSNLPSSSANSVSSRLSTSSRQRDDKEYFFGEETLDSKWKTTDLDSTSISSLEEWIQSDTSFGSKKFVDRVTLTIKQDIEEVYPTDSENEDDDVEYFRTNSSLINDGDTNWFLQRKQFQGTHSPVPVPMLVPNPTTEAKVLIGDKEVDDTSDLSDVASDYGDNEITSGNHSLLIESKTIIGGKNPLKTMDKMENVDQESESSTDSGVKEVGGTDNDIYLAVPAKADITVDDDNVEDASILSVYSNTEKEAEYTERYASLPRTILKTPTPFSRPSLDTNLMSKVENTNTKSEDKLQNGKETENGVDDSDCSEFTGSYSKKEREKWKHAVEMKNNPYSKENIENRIKRSNSAISSLFGPDYYARQASSPSGVKVKSSEVNGISWPPKPQESQNEENNVHQAVPAIIASEDDEVFTRQEQETIQPALQTHTCQVVDVPELNTSEITSDSDISYINFYDVENAQVYKTSHNGVQIILPEPKVWESTRKKSDENGNLPSHNDKHLLVASEEELEIVRKEIPKAKPRTIATNNENKKNSFVKTSPTQATQRNEKTKNTKNAIRKFGSESDLLDSINKPTVLHQKKDNTLISKIYLNPNVRSFALAQRDQIPVDNTETKPGFQKQLSMDAKMFALATSPTLKTTKPSYSSDEGLLSDQDSIRTAKMSFFSSEEDLISLGSDKYPDSLTVFQQSRRRFLSSDGELGEKHLSLLEISAKKTRSPISSSSEDLLSMNNDEKVPKRKDNKLTNNSTRGLIYGSSEDLLSIDSQEKMPKKRDNTLISKIYLDPNVRNFALTNREHIPETPSPKERKKLAYSSDEDILLAKSSKINPRSPLKEETPYHRYEEFSSTDISLVGETVKEPISNEQVTERKIKTPDSDIDELAKKRLVHNMLGQFSNSQPNLMHIKRNSLGETDSTRVSVKDLKMKFENNDDAKNKVISSLTARSLSKQLRETLKN